MKKRASRTHLLLGILQSVTLCVAMMMSAPNSARAAVVDPVKHTHDLIAKYRSLANAKPAQRCAEEQKLAQQFDLNHIVTTALAPQKAALAAQYQLTYDTFLWLIRTVAFRETGSFFEKIEYTVSPEDSNAKRARIEAYDPREDLDIEIIFEFNAKGKVIDVLIDGDSMIMDYRNQFARIATKDGPSAITKKLLERQEKEQAKGVRCPS